MTNRKTTKRALLSSVLALILCFAMLLGSTWAWFTDTDTTNVNTIKSGDLEVALVDKEGNSLEHKPLNFVVPTQAATADETLLWEPGATHVTNTFYIKNLGNLALKYEVVVSGAMASKDDKGLLDVIEFVILTESAYTMLINDQHTWDTFKATAAATFDVAPVLATKNAQSTEGYVVVAHMAETAGNEYENGTLEGVAVTVYATQASYEYDAMGNNTYDANIVTANDADDLEVALTTGGNITISNDIKLGSAKTEINAPSTITLENSVTVTRDGASAAESSVFSVHADTTIGGNGTINNTVGYALNVKDMDTTDDEVPTLIINGGEYRGTTTLVNVVGGNVIINGGWFELTNDKYGNRYMLNIVGAYTDTSSITVYGGTFVDYDPSNSAGENPIANFVAEGYTVEAVAGTGEYANHTLYTVVPVNP